MLTCSDEIKDFPFFVGGGDIFLVENFKLYQFKKKK